MSIKKLFEDIFKPAEYSDIKARTDYVCNATNSFADELKKALPNKYPGYKLVVHNNNFMRLIKKGKDNIVIHHGCSIEPFIEVYLSHLGTHTMWNFPLREGQKEEIYAFIDKLVSKSEGSVKAKKIVEDIFKPADTGEIVGRLKSRHKNLVDTLKPGTKIKYEYYDGPGPYNDYTEYGEVISVHNRRPPYPGSSGAPDTIVDVLMYPTENQKQRVYNLRPDDFEVINESIDPKKLGKCFILSGRYVLEHPDSKLVHGTITRKDGYTIEHGWTEKQTQMGKYNVTMVYDPVLDLELPWDAYERMLGAKVKKKYDAEQMGISMLKAKNWGPWEDIKEDIFTPASEEDVASRREEMMSKPMYKYGKELLEILKGTFWYPALEFNSDVIEDGQFFIEAHYTSPNYHHTPFSIWIDNNSVMVLRDVYTKEESIAGRFTTDYPARTLVNNVIKPIMREIPRLKEDIFKPASRKEVSKRKEEMFSSLKKKKEVVYSYADRLASALEEAGLMAFRREDDDLQVPFVWIKLSKFIQGFPSDQKHIAEIGVLFRDDYTGGISETSTSIWQIWMEDPVNRDIELMSRTYYLPADNPPPLEPIVKEIASYRPEFIRPRRFDTPGVKEDVFKPATEKDLVDRKELEVDKYKKEWPIGTMIKNYWGDTGSIIKHGGKDADGFPGVYIQWDGVPATDSRRDASGTDFYSWKVWQARVDRDDMKRITNKVVEDIFKPATQKDLSTRAYQQWQLGRPFPFLQHIDPQEVLSKGYGSVKGVAFDKQERSEIWVKHGVEINIYYDEDEVMKEYLELIPSMTKEYNESGKTAEEWMKSIGGHLMYSGYSGNEDTYYFWGGKFSYVVFSYDNTVYAVIDDKVLEGDFDSFWSAMSIGAPEQEIANIMGYDTGDYELMVKDIEKWYESEGQIVKDDPDPNTNPMQMRFPFMDDPIQEDIFKPASRKEVKRRREVSAQDWEVIFRIDGALFNVFIKDPDVVQARFINSYYPPSKVISISAEIIQKFLSDFTNRDNIKLKKIESAQAEQGDVSNYWVEVKAVIHCSEMGHEMLQTSRYTGDEDYVYIDKIRL